MKRKSRSGVLGVFSGIDQVVGSIKRLQERGYSDLRIHSPAPFPEIEEVLEKRTSPVRVFALVGAVLGAVSGALLTTLTSLSWPLITGGKPIISIPPFLIIVFELTILFGGVGTLLGVFISAGLPKTSLYKSYEPRFSEDLFGIYVPCPKERFEEAGEILRTNGAKEVQSEED